MRVLLDKNLDHALRPLLGDYHEVFTASYMGWAGLKNGKLPQAAEDNRIDILLTGDQTLVSEQNLTARRLAIVALSAIQLRLIVSNLPLVRAALDNALPGSFQAVDCGSFTRKRKPRT